MGGPGVDVIISSSLSCSDRSLVVDVMPLLLSQCIIEDEEAHFDA